MPSTPKQPVLLTVLIDTAHYRWYVAGIDLEGHVTPLICSEARNLAPYLEIDFDEQVSFLRHRLAGVLQRGCDRLWTRAMKPCQIIFWADRPFAQAAPELTPRVAEHFVEWMTSPPVVFYVGGPAIGHDASGSLNRMAGTLPGECARALEIAVPELWGHTQDLQAWELVPNKPTT